jgi:hypothetical protein
MKYLEFFAFIPIVLYVFCFISVILWVFLEGLVRAYFAFHDREYIPTWITRNFHILVINVSKISIPIIIMAWFFGGGDISSFILTLLICLSVIYTNPSAFKLYNRDVNDRVAKDCQ